MPTWKCNNCGYRTEVPEPPQHCPGCKEACTFVDASCYTPDCGLIDNDPSTTKKSTSDNKIIRVDTWRPETQAEVNKLLDEGWEIVEITNEEHETCHNPSIGSNQTLFYELKKK